MDIACALPSQEKQKGTTSLIYIDILLLTWSHIIPNGWLVSSEHCSLVVSVSPVELHLALVASAVCRAGAVEAALVWITHLATRATIEARVGLTATVPAGPRASA